MRRNKRKKREFEIKLEEEFPFMRQKEVTGEQWELGGYSIYDAYGFEHNKGWYELLRGLCLEITNAYDEAGVPVDIVVKQVKQKFGTLRFYYHPDGKDPGIHALDFMGSGKSLRKTVGESGVHKKVSEIVRKWEEKSATVCEICGTPGKLRDDLGWIITLCESCYQEIMAKREENIRREKERAENPELAEAQEEKRHIEIREQTLTLERIEDKNVRELTIPEWANFIDNEVIEACDYIVNIFVDPLNKTYYSVDGVLFESKRKRFYGQDEYEHYKQISLVRYPPRKEQDIYSIPEGVNHINSNAFRNCIKPINLHLPSSLEQTSFFGIFSDSRIKEITVSEDNQAFSDIDGVLFSKYKTELYCYPPEKGSLSYDVPEGVRKIWHDSFKNAHKLSNIKIPDSVGFIGNRAFESCVSLKRITLPIATFNDNCRVFYNCPSLEFINISQDVQKPFFAGNHFNSKGGVLFKGPISYTKGEDRTEYVKHILMRYPEAKQRDTYVVPPTVTHLLEYAFSGQKYLRKILILNNVTQIDEGVFENCHEELTLHCSENSTAHEYAIKNGIKWELLSESDAENREVM